MPFVSFGTDIFGDKTLQLPVHLFKLREGLTVHGSLFENRHFVR